MWGHLPIDSTKIFLSGCGSQYWGVYVSAKFAGGVIHSFEPHHKLFKVLKKNCEQLKNVKLHNKALSKDKGFFDLYIPQKFESNEGIASLEPIEGAEKIQVETTTMDFLFPNQTVDLLKIDVEGHEMDVFRGAKTMFEQKRIRNIVFEEFGGSQSETVQFLKSNGYHVCRLPKGFFNLKLLTPEEGDSLPLWEPPNYLASLEPIDGKKYRTWQILSK